MKRKTRRKRWRFLWRVALSLIGLLFAFVFAAVILQLVENTRYEIASQPSSYIIRPPAHLARFSIADPYAVGGRYLRVQLHTHTNRSTDGRIPPSQVAASYRAAGYDAVFLTDHDRITDMTSLGDRRFLVLPGEEDTVTFGTWPLGKHLLRLGVRRLLVRKSATVRIEAATREGGLAAPAHPNWRGNLGTGRWYASDLLRLKGYRLLEIANPHSDDPRDLTLWHMVMAKRGPTDPVWGIAVDDSHYGSNNQGWVWVKAARLDEGSILAALRRGSFYASLGPTAVFGVENGAVTAASPGADWIRFVDLRQRVVAVVRGSKAAYKPMGDEGFVRVEVESGSKIAYSQPFWLLPEG